MYVYVCMCVSVCVTLLICDRDMGEQMWIDYKPEFVVVTTSDKFHKVSCISFKMSPSSICFHTVEFYLLEAKDMCTCHCDVCAMYRLRDTAVESRRTDAHHRVIIV